MHFKMEDMHPYNIHPYVNIANPPSCLFYVPVAFGDNIPVKTKLSLSSCEPNLVMQKAKIPGPRHKTVSNSSSEKVRTLYSGGSDGDC
jgi:hypothetical protein